MPQVVSEYPTRSHDAFCRHERPLDVVKNKPFQNLRKFAPNLITRCFASKTAYTEHSAQVLEVAAAARGDEPRALAAQALENTRRLFFPNDV